MLPWKESCPLFPAKRTEDLKNIRLIRVSGAGGGQYRNADFRLAEPICRVYPVSMANGGVYRGGGVCSAWHTATQNKRGYAHLTERGPDIPGTDKNDCTAVKLAQEGKE